VRALPIPKIDEVKKWLWLRKRVIYASLTFTATIMLVFLSIDPNTRESERAIYVILALCAFFATIWLWLKQIEFVNEHAHVEEYEFLTFPIEKEEPIEEGEEPVAVNLKSAPEPPARPKPPKQRANIKPWCPYCGSVHVIARDKRIYCLDCGQIARAEKVRGA